MRRTIKDYELKEVCSQSQSNGVQNQQFHMFCTIRRTETTKKFHKLKFPRLNNKTLEIWGNFPNDLTKGGTEVSLAPSQRHCKYRWPKKNSCHHKKLNVFQARQIWLSIY